jgi:hypothetical protein
VTCAIPPQYDCGRASRPARTRTVHGVSPSSGGLSSPRESRRWPKPTVRRRPSDISLSVSLTWAASASRPTGRTFARNNFPVAAARLANAGRYTRRPGLSECRHRRLARCLVAVRRGAVLVVAVGKRHIHGASGGVPFRGARRWRGRRPHLGMSPQKHARPFCQRSALRASHNQRCSTSRKSALSNWSVAASAIRRASAASR